MASLLLGDLRDVLPTLESDSIDAVVCDPPYELGFMGKAWDRAGVSFQRETWAEVFRVLKPGGHLLAFGGTRTYHRIAVAIEDAGFDVRDQIVWLYGSGFPKSLDAAKAIDKHLGRKGTYDGVRPGHEDFVERTDPSAAGGRSDGWSRPWQDDPDARERHHQAYVTASEEAASWQGWGTALKPAMEPIVVARKPLVGTVAANLLEHGVGAINVDGCRIGMSEADRDAARVPQPSFGSKSGLVYGFQTGEGRNGAVSEPASGGRWPANVVLAHTDDCVQVGTREVASDGHFPSARPVGVFGRVGQDDLEERHTRGELVEEWECAEDCPVRILDEQTGEMKDGVAVGGLHSASGSNAIYARMARIDGAADHGYGGSGGASRFFYTAKTSRAERDAGLDDFEDTPAGVGDHRPSGDMNERLHRGRLPVFRRNDHPTVKPVELMRWLVRLVTPTGGTVLDPFLGSGTTGIAAALEGFDFVGVEREPDYLAIAEARIRFWQEYGEDALEVVRRRDEADRRRAAVAESGQLDLLA